MKMVYNAKTVSAPGEVQQGEAVLTAPLDVDGLDVALGQGILQVADADIRRDVAHTQAEVHGGAGPATDVAPGSVLTVLRK